MTSDNWSNAEIIHREDLTPELAIFRIRPDAPIPDWVPGHFVQLGLPYGTPYVDPGFQVDKEPPADLAKVLKRPYSIASSPKQKDYYEIYISLLRSGDLTPRLWTRQVGDRIWVGAKPLGIFTLEHIAEDRDILMISTGTGLAPFLSMALTYTESLEKRRFIIVHRVRQPQDLAYRKELTELAERIPNLVYVPTVTRAQPDDAWDGLTERIRDMVHSGTLERIVGGIISPEALDVMLCGNPDMIDDMNETFEQMGFTRHTRKQAGNLHFEKYW